MLSQKYFPLLKIRETGNVSGINLKALILEGKIKRQTGGGTTLNVISKM